MYSLSVQEQEFYDSEKNEFVTIPGGTLELEHSLISVSKWESKYKRAFLSEKEGPKTYSEWIDYIRCMTINKHVNDSIYNSITNQQVNDVAAYIGDTMTATTFSERPGARGRRSSGKITNEVIYWQMSQYNIPFECEKWHLNRLLTLIRVCNEKGQPPQKMSQNDLLKQYSATNAKRRAAKKHH